ncbi:MULTISPECIES: hypothetical protein [Pseudoalteromonas]|uniref:Uncharacterized protein n=3 Tax=Pseudoalteromonas TaxID=53246 RepID=A0AAD0RHD2_PSEO7|nr:MULTISPECIES: hypothetical protein [Pseudoalteromonas]MCG7538388.1 hypothetical protein [Pseudoalteromonas sp. OF7H-1]MCO7201714.1 hypothetical protein [Pseudoalteromonas sp. OANN1]ASD67666.1 hypothetical protein B1L02_12000 [Pseudoalteromonas piscicida]AXQ98642.1 hypothetical protein D0N37_13480 [Pseudoalteromonas piscicida]AXR01630.1 hypothetical protein D0511_05735 [Pseudoalteromonas piscicida]
MNHPEQWQMKKEFNLAHILTTIALLVSGVIYLGDLDKRITTNSQELDHLKQIRQEDQKRIEKRLDSIDKKLDTLLGARRVGP